MKNSISLLLRFATSFSLLVGAILYAEDEIRVELATRTPLTPVYLCGFSEGGSALSPGYAEQLKKVLQFDLRTCGFVSIAPTDDEVEKALSSADPKTAFSSPLNAGAPYVIKAVVEQKQINLYVFTVKNGNLKQFPAIALSGDLNQDRRQIHKLSDGIVSSLFNSKGVAGTRVLYSVQLNPLDSSPGKWRSEIWECDYDGASVRQVTQEENFSITPVMIPGSDRYVYVSYKTGQPKIYLSSVKQRTGRRIVDIRGNQILPAVSQQRDKIAFICDASGRADLFVQKIDQNGELIDKPVQLFSYPNSTQGSPTFSPDGAKIAFVSDKDGAARIYLIPSSFVGKRPQPQLITKINRENTCPSWSPDGTKLAYSAKTNGIRQIWIYDFATGEERQLTAGPGNKENPVWGPNSLHLIFNSTDPSSSELYLVNLNQPEAVKITQGPGKKHYPTWGTR